MNTNRGSYLLGAALGSALVLTLCVKAHAADIYEAPPEPVVEAVPPPVLTAASTSRATSARPTRTSATSGPKATTPTASRCSTTTSRARRCSASASAGSTATGCASTSRVSIAATRSFVGQDTYPGGFGFTRRHERVHGRHPELARPRQRLHRHGQLVRLHALRRRGHRFRHALGQRLEGRQRRRQGSAFYGADHTNTNFAWALYAGTSYDVTPQVTFDLSYRYANLGNAKSGVVHRLRQLAAPTAACSSRTSPRTI